jgi:hypothetical protein
MRFIWNFLFFGILFYLIWMIFPDAFLTLVSWADHVVSFFKDLILNLWGKIQHRMPSQAPKTLSPAGLLFLFSLARSGK